MSRYLLAFIVAFSARAAAESLPVPPLPPANLKMAQIAPVPDPDVQAPRAQAVDLSLNVHFYRATTYDPSQGFTPGSRFQSSEDRKPIQTPGLSFSMPIQ